MTGSAEGRRLHQIGASAVLVSCAPDDVVGLLAAVDAAIAEGALPGVVDVVPARSSLLVVTRGRVADAWDTLSGLESQVVAASGSAEVVIPVVYDGADLADVAAVTGMGVGEVIDRHVRAEYVVAFCGFAPGFAYLTGIDPALAIPRRPSPRPRVPRGSVAVAADFTAVYPGESPGGWHLLGRTDLPVFDPDRSPPTPLTPGTRVRFEIATTETVGVGAGDVRAEVPASGARTLEVLDVRGLALVEDLGRPGHGRIAVGRSGAFDRRALRLANRLVGNPEGVAGLEVIGRLRLRFDVGTTIAVTGAPCSVEVGGLAVDVGSPVPVAPGAEVVIGPARGGLRTYVAVRGGVLGRSVLGSPSSDSLGGIGTPPLRPGDVVAIGDPVGPVPGVDHVPVEPAADPLVLAVHPGPQQDWFTADAWQALTSAAWVVSGVSDRIGVRLEGPELPRLLSAEMTPAGMVRGAVQVPPEGRPVILGPDHPVTGGYPVIAVVDDIDALAQAAPGTGVRFAPAR